MHNEFVESFRGTTRPVTSRHVMTLCLARAFWHRKKSWRAAPVSSTRLDTHVTTRVYNAHAAYAQMRRSVGDVISSKQRCKRFVMNDSFFCLPSEANQSNRKFTEENDNNWRWACWHIRIWARHARHVKALSCVSWRDGPNGIEFYPVILFGPATSVHY